MNKIIVITLLLLNVFFTKAQVIINQPTDYLICEYDNNGIEIFNLNYISEQILIDLNSLEYIVSYHYSLLDAENGISAIPAPDLDHYQNLSNPETLYVRLERLSDGAYDTTSFDLIVGQFPTANTPNPIILIDEDENGYGIFDLTIRHEEINSGEPNVSISYFETENGALQNQNPIFDPTNYVNIQTPQQTIYVRVNNDDIGCWEVVELIIIVDVIPFVPIQIQDLIVYDVDGDGLEVFDLTVKITEIVGSQAGLEVTFYETESDAENKINGIENPETYQNIENPQTIYARVETQYGTFALGSFIIFADPNLSTDSFTLNNLIIYPNPTKGILHLKNISINQPFNFSLFDINGRKLFTKTLSNRDNELNMSHLPSGTYLIHISIGKISFNSKIIKK